MTKEEARLSVMGAISMALKDSTLQQGFEIICKELSDFEKENAELKAYNEKLLNGDIEKHNKIVELVNENAELKAKNKWYSKQICNKECAEVWGKLTEAKEIMRIGIEGTKREFIFEGQVRPFVKEAKEMLNDFVEKAEQFLKE